MGRLSSSVRTLALKGKPEAAFTRLRSRVQVSPGPSLVDAYLFDVVGLQIFSLFS